MQTWFGRIRSRSPTFTPFSAAGQADEDKAAPEPERHDDLRELKDQIAAMQKRLEQMGK